MLQNIKLISELFLEIMYIKHTHYNLWLTKFASTFMNNNCIVTIKYHNLVGKWNRQIRGPIQIVTYELF